MTSALLRGGTGVQLVAVSEAPITYRFWNGAFTRKVSVSPAVQVNGRGVQSKVKQNSPAVPAGLVPWEPNTPGRTWAVTPAEGSARAAARRRVEGSMWVSGGFRGQGPTSIAGSGATSSAACSPTNGGRAAAARHFSRRARYIAATMTDSLSRR